MTNIHGSPLVSFKKSDFDDAPLTCSTNISCHYMSFGCTANSKFFQCDGMNLSSSIFLHDSRTFDFIYVDKNDFRWNLNWRYSSFYKLNFEICCEDGDQYFLKLTFIVKDAPNLTHEVDDENDVPFSPDFDEYRLNLADSSAYQIEFWLVREELDAFLGQLYNLLSCPITYSSMEIHKFDLSQVVEFDAKSKSLSWDIRYHIEAIKSFGIVGKYFLFYVFCQNRKLSIMHLSEESIITHLESMYEHLKGDISLSSLTFHLVKRGATAANDSVRIKIICITPTRMIYGLDTETADCRAFRMFGVKNMIQIKFCDENLSHFPSYSPQCIKERVKLICTDGIKICGRQYYELAASSSLFREDGAIFYATNDKRDIPRLLNEIGDFKEESAAKVAARIGLFFSSSTKFRKISQGEVYLIEDFESNTLNSAGKPYCFSDGCGIISSQVAEDIARHLGLRDSYTPSAFQIRYAGYKGMLAVDRKDERLIGNGGKYVACFRDSQKKFDVRDYGKSIDFDIVAYSKPLPAKFPRPFTAILDWLTRDAGVEKYDQFRQQLWEMQKQEFNNLMIPLLYENAFIDCIIRLPKYVPVTKMKAKHLLLNEPFFRSMVSADAIQKATSLVKKARLPIDENDGRSAFGIIDTTGSLREGEIFFQYSETANSKNPSKRKIIKVGPVGITRSPIYRGGDICFVEAVDAPDLHHLVDVLVFPTDGIRPLSSDIGGGDLDGDLYIVFWNSAFLLPYNAPAADYTILGTENLATVNLDQLQEASANHREEYMQNNYIGNISTTHLAHLCDLPPDHPDVERIAKKADVAVNFFKSGIPAEPLEFYEKVKFFPKYMEKRNCPAYTNSNILNELHDFSDTLYNLIEIAVKEDEKLHRKTRYTVDNAEILKDDREMFGHYKAEVHAIMNEHKIQSEGELFANTYHDLPGMNRKSNNKRLADARKTVSDIFRKFREIILDFFSKDWRRKMEEADENIFSFKLPNLTPEMIRLAKSYYALAQEDGSCLSFPWIIWEGLDAWWSKTPIFTVNSFGRKFETDLSFQLNDDENDILQNFQEPYLQYPWITTFTEIFYEWRQTQEVNICHEDQHSLLNHFINLTKKADSNGYMIMTEKAGDLFYKFLTMIIQIDLEFVEDSQRDILFQAAYATIILAAFSPESNIFENLNTKIIAPPPFVISVPRFWSQLFQEQYKLLEEESGCKEVKIRLRYEHPGYHHFTIMSRGTLEACQKLEKMLTPVVEANPESSMQEIKKQKWRAMKKLLQNLFDFPYECYARNSTSDEGSGAPDFLSNCRRRRRRFSEAHDARERLPSVKRSPNNSISIKSECNN